MIKTKQLYQFYETCYHFFQSLSPAGVKTELGAVGGIEDEHLSKIPLMQPSDIADAVVYLLSTKPEINVSELTIHPSGDIF